MTTLRNPTHERLIRRFDYNHWANERTLAALEATPEIEPRGTAIFAHILGAESEWLARITADRSAVLPVWPDATLEDCRAWLVRLRAQYDAYLDEARDLHDTLVEYTNSVGETHRTPLLDTLDHVLLHSHYHRGQLAARIAGAGGTPAVTDYIAWART